MEKYVRGFILFIATILWGMLPIESVSAAPSDFAVILTGAEGTSQSEIKVKWEINENVEGFYFVFRKSGDEDYRCISVVDPCSKLSNFDGKRIKYQFCDRTVLPNKKYTYKVQFVSASEMIRIFSYSYHRPDVENLSDMNQSLTLTWKAPQKDNVKEFLIFENEQLIETIEASDEKERYAFECDLTEKEDMLLKIYGVPEAASKIVSDNEVSAKATISSTKIKSVSIVANRRVRIGWSKVKGATGYLLYRRESKKEEWKRIATLSGESQTYAYDGNIKKKKNYYYTVKPFVKTDEGKAVAEWDQTGYKASFEKVTVSKVSGDYKPGSVYGPSLSSKKLAEVRAAVQKFCDTYITSDMSDIEKAMIAQLYLEGKCVYAASWSDNGANTAWGALVYTNSKGYHEAQCSGYARAYKALCDGMGVKCRYVHANKISYNPEHQWNMVQIDKKWYIVDTQGSWRSGELFFFLWGKNKYCETTKMNWDKSAYPKVTEKSYPVLKIYKVYHGYKVQKAYRKMNKNK
ncbi:MAG: hypothetical protein NC180_02370 [Muribaculaceae bacterium]|nr:hypothetical protein [Muribaculaceae bacterium]MCM1492049.1 hypothetical protein [Muribaculaceae bacterium]